MRKIIKPYSLVVVLFLIIIMGLFQYAFASNIEVYFSPEDKPEDKIISLLDKVENTINIAMYCFTDRDLSQAVVRAQERGVRIKVYLDKSQVHARYSSSRYLIKNRIPVRISSNNHLMHNKFAIIDHRIVLTGSYNWTAHAEKNDENLLAITDEEIARIFNDKFRKFVYELANIDWEKTVKVYELAGFFFIGSMKSNKYHCPLLCPFAKKILMDNEIWFRSAEEAVAAGYEPCKICNPPECPKQSAAFPGYKEVGFITSGEVGSPYPSCFFRIT